MNTYQPLRDPDPAAAGGGGAGAPAGGTPPLNDFVKSLPVDLQTEKSLHNMTDAATLAKGYVHAQKMIGTKRLAAPDGTWTEAQWNEFYDGVGRPKTAGDYKMPTIKGLDPKTVDKTRWEATAADLHKAGLTQRQAEVVLTRYWNDAQQLSKGQETTKQNERLSAEAALKAEWADKYDANVNLAKSVVTKFGTPEFMDYLSGNGNDPKLIKTLAAIGAAMLDDHSRGGSAADGLQVTDATRATQEIARLKIDGDFQKAFLNKEHPGHKAAVQQWMNLHKVAQPNKIVEPS